MFTLLLMDLDDVLNDLDGSDCDDVIFSVPCFKCAIVYLVEPFRHFSDRISRVIDLKLNEDHADLAVCLDAITVFIYLGVLFENVVAHITVELVELFHCIVQVIVEYMVDMKLL